MPDVAHAAPLPCPAWVWLKDSNVHAAKDRAWFGDDYKQHHSVAKNMYGPDHQVIGIGSVNVPTKVSANKKGPSSHGTLSLKMVLHVPDAICNIIGSPLLDDYNVVKKSGAEIITSQSDGRNVAYLQPDARLLNGYHIRLSGQPVGPAVGPSPFDGTTTYRIHAFWPEPERAKFMSSNATCTWSSEEIRWVKKHYGSEDEFFVECELDQGREEDRKQGQNLVQAMIAKQQHLEEEIEYRLNSQASVADHHFTPKELESINRRHGSSAMFMYFKKLNFFIDEDCDEARKIARAWVEEDEKQSKYDYQSNDSADTQPNDDVYEPEINTTDCIFTPSQTEAIKADYGSTEHFMTSYGLKFYREDDVEQARVIADAAYDVSDSDADGREGGYNDWDSEQEDIIKDPDEDEITDTMLFLRLKAEDPEISPAEKERIIAQGRYYIKARYGGPEDDKRDEDDYELPKDLVHNAHFADKDFSDAQLEWMQKDYNTVRNFMLFHGLQLDRNEHLQEAKRLVESMMTEVQRAE